MQHKNVGYLTSNPTMSLESCVKVHTDNRRIIHVSWCVTDMFAQQHVLPCVIGIRLMVKLICRFKIEWPLLKFLQEGFILLHRGELQEHKAHQKEGAGAWVCRLLDTPGPCSTANESVHCWWMSGQSASRGRRCGSLNRRTRTPPWERERESSGDSLYLQNTLSF